MLGWILVATHLVGVVSAVRAVFETRTSQGSIAWALSLVFVPYIALPSYWLLGQSRFDGYKFLRRRRRPVPRADTSGVRKRARDLGFSVGPEQKDRRLALLERLASMPFTSRNHVELLVNGPATFERIFAAIAEAEHYVLVEFYTLSDDSLGRRLAEELAARAAAGLRVHVLFDEVGSYDLPKAFVEGLRKRGVLAQSFESSRGRGPAARLNFRNHRKLVVVDGRIAFVGGHNASELYLGEADEFPHWRDTHVAVHGPAALGAQVAFAEDWLWARGEGLDLAWQPTPADDGDMTALVVPSGPADIVETATLMLLEVIHSAQRRLWIASPYFVPESEILLALQLAALHGVDVRILMPEHSDERFVHLASYSYLTDLDRVGIRLYRYLPGMMHQKVILVDDALASVGSLNMDNRSLRLNFEMTTWVHDTKFAAEVEAMLLADFERSRLSKTEEYTGRSFWFRLGVRFVRLFAPIL
ncbi:MAG: cardiolipin synthase [Planctomycetaceae bacterium]|nr:cardiolipin synthase [Planctomycetaceae bacterium]